MEYLRGVRVLRSDPNVGSKLLYGSLLVFVAGIIPLLPALVLNGWNALAMRRAAQNDDTLPRLDLDFDYYGKLLPIGFKVFIANLLWGLPLALIIPVCGCSGWFATLTMAGVGAQGGGEAGGLAAVCAGIGFSVILIPLFIVLALPIQVAVIRVSLTDDLNSALRLGEVVAMTRMLVRELLVATVVMFGIGLVLALATMITCGLAAIPGAVVIGVIQTYLSAEVYDQYLEKGGEPLPIGPTDYPPADQAAAAPPTF
ncbi:MAG: DUF4013 domain-containing protein [Sandaracinaceae bacterium]